MSKDTEKVKGNPPIELRHEAVSELLGAAPGWLTRWGISVFCSVILVLLVGAYFFRYPVVITAPITITTEQPAVWVVAQASGRIDSIYVADHAPVEKYQILAVINNTADTRDVFTLKEQLALLHPFVATFDTQAPVAFGQHLNVGELQDMYAQLAKSVATYTVFAEEQYHSRKVASLEHELIRQKQHLSNLNRQVSAYERSYSILSKQYTRDSILAAQKTIADIELENVQQQQIGGEIQLRQAQTAVSTGMITIARLQQEISEYKTDFRNQQVALQASVSTAYTLLQSALLAWEAKYLLKAPLAGRVSFMSFWGKDQYISAGERSFAVVPSDHGSIVGKCNVPTGGLGKLQKGQNVVVKLDEYPYMEYGMLLGKVANISLIPMHVSTPEAAVKLSAVEVAFPDTLLTTTYSKAIPFTGELTGAAEIATEEMSLLEHLINPLKYLWSKTGER
ncbi:MAG: HlyD family secretion protein [Prevotellaceae bacterium]|jgi:HlyD family secretion protein|nr:HlyD family secretion protein [Prevotellaceae bacterium]